MSHACDYNVSNNSILLTLHIVIPFQSHYDNNNCNLKIRVLKVKLLNDDIKNTDKHF